MSSSSLISRKTEVIGVGVVSFLKPAKEEEKKAPPPTLLFNIRFKQPFLPLFQRGRPGKKKKKKKKKEKKKPLVNIKLNSSLRPPWPWPWPWPHATQPKRAHAQHRHHRLVDLAAPLWPGASTASSQNNRMRRAFAQRRHIYTFYAYCTILFLRRTRIAATATRPLSALASADLRSLAGALARHSPLLLAVAQASGRRRKKKKKKRCRQPRGGPERLSIALPPIAGARRQLQSPLSPLPSPSSISLHPRMARPRLGAQTRTDASASCQEPLNAPPRGGAEAQTSRDRGVAFCLTQGRGSCGLQNRPPGEVGRPSPGALPPAAAAAANTPPPPPPPPPPAPHPPPPPPSTRSSPSIYRQRGGSRPSPHSLPLFLFQWPRVLASNPPQTERQEARPLAPAREAEAVELSLFWRTLRLASLASLPRALWLCCPGSPPFENAPPLPECPWRVLRRAAGGAETAHNSAAFPRGTEKPPLVQCRGTSPPFHAPASPRLLHVRGRESA